MEREECRFREGQVWSYLTRPGEEQSLCTVCRVERSERLGWIIHVALDALKIKMPDGTVVTQIQHLPFSPESLGESVVKLECELGVGALPDYRGGYDHWREDHDTGGGGYWTISLAEAVTAMESTVEGGRELIDAYVVGPSGFYDDPGVSQFLFHREGNRPEKPILLERKDGEVTYVIVPYRMWGERNPKADFSAGRLGASREEQPEDPDSEETLDRG